MIDRYEVNLTFTNEVLGTCSNDKEIHEHFIAAKAPDAKSREEEIASVGVGGVVEKTTTVFPRDEEGNPFIFDYQVKGFFKDACSMLGRVQGSYSKKLRAYKKTTDGLIFVSPRKIPFKLPEGGVIGRCQRPLRASTPMGERIALAHSETLPEGTQIDFIIQMFKLADVKINLEKCLYEWLEYGALRGIGQWRNSGRGTFIAKVNKL